MEALDVARNPVLRPDGQIIHVARPRGQLFVCATGCCCGRTTDGFPPVPAELYHEEWERRRLRNTVHLTIGGCLGPCALANVVLLLFDGHAVWFHSMNSDALVLALYDHVEAMVKAGRFLPAPPPSGPCSSPPRRGSTGPPARPSQFRAGRGSEVVVTVRVCLPATLITERSRL